jgi:hypothetical protein
VEFHERGSRVAGEINVKKELHPAFFPDTGKDYLNRHRQSLAENGRFTCFMVSEALTQCQ